MYECMYVQCGELLAFNIPVYYRGVRMVYTLSNRPYSNHYSSHTNNRWPDVWAQEMFGPRGHLGPGDVWSLKFGPRGRLGPRGKKKIFFYT